MRRSILSLASSIVFLWATPAFAQSAPEWTVDLPAQPGDYRYTLVRDPAGAIFVAGSKEVSPGNWDLYLVKFTSDGQKDASWGNAGEMTYDTGGSPADDELSNDLEIDSLGRMYITADRTNLGGGLGNPVVLRVLADGTVDTSWGTNGLFVITIAAAGAEIWTGGASLDAAAPPNLYVTGYFRPSGMGLQPFDSYVLKLDTDGVPDPAFTNSGQNGVATWGSSTMEDLTYGVTADATGVYACGLSHAGWSTTNPPDSADAVVLKFTLAGAPDPAFGSSGLVLYDGPGGLGDEGNKVRVSGGRLYVLGITVAGTSAAPDLNGLVFVLDAATGAPDVSWGSGGARTWDSGRGNDTFEALAVDAAGKVVAAGDTPNATNPADTDMLIVRYNPDGSLDSTFGSGGVYTGDSGTFDSTIGVALGSIYALANYGTNNVRLMKFSDPATPPSPPDEDKDDPWYRCGLLGGEFLVLLLGWAFLRRTRRGR